MIFYCKKGTFLLSSHQEPQYPPVTTLGLLLPTLLYRQGPAHQSHLPELAAALPMKAALCATACTEAVAIYSLVTGQLDSVWPP
jgi:hypothetical protein